MSLDAIRQVGESERAAQQLVSDAQMQARSMIAQAQHAADMQVESAQKTAAQQASEAAAAARERSAQAAAEQLASARADCVTMRENAMTHMSKAVSIVVEKVVNG